MKILSFILVFTQLFLLLPIGVVGPPTTSADETISITSNKKQMSIFIKILNNFLTEKCPDFKQSLFYTKDNPTLKKSLLQKNILCIAKIRMSDFVNVFDEKIQQQMEQQPQNEQSSSSSAIGTDEMQANEFFKKYMEKIKENFPKTQKQIELEQKLVNYRNLFILQELIALCEPIEKLFQIYETVPKENGYKNAVVDLGYHSELLWKLMVANIIISDILEKGSVQLNFDLALSSKEERHDPTPVDVELSVVQITAFIANIDKFLESKCELQEKASVIIENVEQENILDQCIFDLKISELGNFFKKETNAVQEKQQQEQTANDFLEVLLGKIIERLPKKKERQQISLNNLSDEQNLIALLKLFKITKFLSHQVKDLLHDDKQLKQMFIIKKFAAVEYVIHRTLEKKFKESLHQIYYAHDRYHLKIPFLQSMDKSNAEKWQTGQFDAMGDLIPQNRKQILKSLGFSEM